MLKAQNITKKYEQLSVLKGVSIEVKKAEIVSIVGSSGAGKSTLLHILGTLDNPDEGEITIDNTNLTKLIENSCYSCSFSTDLLSSSTIRKTVSPVFFIKYFSRANFSIDFTLPITSFSSRVIPRVRLDT